MCVMSYMKGALSRAEVRASSGCNNTAAAVAALISCPCLCVPTRSTRSDPPRAIRMLLHLNNCLHHCGATGNHQAFCRQIKGESAVGDKHRGC